jgi:hypothetical protein
MTMPPNHFPAASHLIYNLACPVLRTAEIYVHDQLVALVNRVVEPYKSVVYFGRFIALRALPRIHLGLGAILDPLRSDPCFTVLLRKMNLQT